MCEQGFSMNGGKCSACREGGFGRVTTFGIIVLTIALSALSVMAALYLSKVGEE